MKRNFFAVSAIVAFLGFNSFPAHATGIDDFVLVGEGHTITYSLPDSGIVADHPHGVIWGLEASTTIDGVSGYTTSGGYYVPRLLLPSFVLYVPSSIDGGELVLWGSNIVTATVIPISDPIPIIHPDDLLVTFVPGTYSLVENNTLLLPDPHANAPYTLTITAESTATPEPSALVLLSTGGLGLLELIRRRRNAKS